MSAQAPTPTKFCMDVLQQRAEIRHRTATPITAAARLQRLWRACEGGNPSNDGVVDGRMLAAVRAALNPKERCRYERAIRDECAANPVESVPAPTRRRADATPGAVAAGAAARGIRGWLPAMSAFTERAICREVVSGARLSRVIGRPGYGRHVMVRGTGRVAASYDDDDLDAFTALQRFLREREEHTDDE